MRLPLSHLIRALSPAHPMARRLLALAAASAVVAWEAGHLVDDIHPRTKDRRA
ncbi:hypothetical protein [Streptomyces sp. NPDC055085]